MPHEFQYVIGIDEEFVKKIGELSKICIEEDQEALLNSIQNVIKLIQELDKLSDLEVPAEDNRYIISLDELIRSDEVNLDHTDHLKKYFPHFKGGYFIVPSYIQQE